MQELLDQGHSFRTAADALGISPGEAYLTATGRPADGSDGRYFSDPRELPPSPQQLVGPPAHNPMGNSTVRDWIRERAARELEPRS